MRDGPAGGRNHSAHRDTRHTGGAGGGTQSRAVREFQRQPPPRLAAWHAGLRAPLQGSAGRATQSRPVRELPTPTAAKTGGVARKTARSTSSRCPPWSMPPGLPCRRSRRQSHTLPTCTGVSTPSAPHACALHLKPPRPVGADQCVRPLFSYLRALRVLCGLLFPCPPHPQSQPSPNLFSFPFQPLPNSPFLLLLLPSCMLKVKGAADALVGARTADGASPGQQRRRLQPLPSPDGGELRSLKPAAGGEQAGGGLLT